MAEGKPDIQAQLNALKEAYVLGLDTQFAALEAAWSDGPEEGRLKAVQSAAHKLAGSGGTFGLPLMSQAARALEHLVQAALKGDAPEDPALGSKILLAVADIRRAAGEDRGLNLPVDLAPDPAQGTCIHLLLPDARLRNDLLAHLSSFGQRVEDHPTPASLWMALELDPPCLVILDAESLQGEPVDLAPLARFQAGRAQPVPVVFLSDRVDLGSRLAAVRAGGRAYLPKPVEPFAVLDKLDELNLGGDREALQVLVVEDDPVLAQNHALILQQAGVQVQTVTDPLKVMRPLVDQRPDLVLLDMHMPGCSGLELASVIRQQDAFVGIPIVFLSGEQDRAPKLEAMRLGADDFLQKPVPAQQLTSLVVSRALRGRRLRAFMNQDSLTGLLNHSALKEQLNRELSRALRNREPLTLAMVDLDHFKRVNDTHGHPGGDRVLRSLARLLQQRLRKTDLIGRYGGEEFAVILPGTPLAQAQQVMENLRASFSAIHFPFEKEPRSLTLSCGLAAFPAFESASDLTMAADQALYQAKAQGRNCVRVAE